MKHNRDLIKQLGAQIGLPDLHLSDEGICELVLPDGAEFFLEGAPNGVVLHLNGVVGYVHLPSTELLRQLLSANHNGQATGSAALALNSGNPAELLLSQCLHVKQMRGIEPVMAALEDFLKILAFWVDYLPQLSAGQAAGPPADSLAKYGAGGYGLMV